MVDTHVIEDLARRLTEAVPPAVRDVQQDLEENFRGLLQNSLSRLDLVTREEFEVQAKVLERTREKLERLEAELERLESQDAATD